MNTSRPQELSVLQAPIFLISFLNWACSITVSKTFKTIAEFKQKVLEDTIRPVEKPVYNVYNITGIRNLIKIQVDFSPVNEHRFWHNFDCWSPCCVCDTGTEIANIFSSTRRPLYKDLLGEWLILIAYLAVKFVRLTMSQLQWELGDCVSLLVAGLTGNVCI